MENCWLTYSDVKFVIISRGRSETITSHKLFPYATLVCPISEVENYKHCGLEIKPCGDEIIGLSLLRNWCINNFKEKVVVMIDDDVSMCSRIDNVRYKEIVDTDEIRQLVINTAQNAMDIGTNVFGFAQRNDVRIYNAGEPFILKGWVGGVIGVIGKDDLFIDNKFKVDIDFCLESLLHRRVIWKDNRIAFTQIRDTNVGGNSSFRTEEEVEQEKIKLKKKWGKYIEFKDNKSGSACNIKVKRRVTYNGLQ
jgi:hypothetical protein